MGTSAKVGSFSAATSTGNQSVTGLGFQPKALILWGNLTSGGTTTNSTTAAYCFGMTDGTNNRCSGHYFLDNATDTTVTWVSMNKVYYLRDGSGLIREATISSFSSSNGGEFVINWSTASATAHNICYMALGGSDITNVAVGTKDYAASTGNQAVTGLGFQPSLVVLVLPDDGSTANNYYANANVEAGHGVVTSSGEGAIGYRMRASSQSMKSSLKGNAIYVTGATVAREVATYVSMDSGGFTLNFTTATGPQPASYMAIRTTGSVKVGIDTTKGSTGTKSTTTSFKPAAVMFWSACRENLSGVLWLDTNIMVGAADWNLNNRAVWFGLRDGVTTQETDQAINVTNAIEMWTESTPTLQERAAVSAVDTTSFTLNYGTASATNREFVYMAFGQPTVLFDGHTVSGGLTSGGSASHSRSFVKSASGGLATGCPIPDDHYFFQPNNVHIFPPSNTGVQTGGAATTADMYCHQPTITGGLVAGGTGNAFPSIWSPLTGGDHLGADWIISTNTTLAGRHYNVRSFVITSGTSVTVGGYTGSSITTDANNYGYVAELRPLYGGVFALEALSITIAGTLTADGAGLGGGGGGGSGPSGACFASGSVSYGGAGGSGHRGGGNGSSGTAASSSCTYNCEAGGDGGNGGSGGGPYGGSYGAGRVTCATSMNGFDGSNGGYRGSAANGDSTTDNTLCMGSGGGGAGGGHGGHGSVCNCPDCESEGYQPCRAGGGGGAGGTGGGAIRLHARSSLRVSGTISAKGVGGGNGTNADDASNKPGVAGGNAATAGSSTGGTSHWSGGCCVGGAGIGGNGGTGAGGGILLWCDGPIGISVSGTIDTRSSGNSTTNGGTLKIRSLVGRASTSGSTLNVGRDHRTETLKRGHLLPTSWPQTPVQHLDSNHVNTAHSNVAHQNVPHANSHTDVAHSNYAHTNTPHTNTHTDSAHVNVPHDDVAYGDVAHQDVAHVNVPHEDTAYGDVSHLDEYNDYTDLPLHIDRHFDRDHTDTPHADSHGDTAHQNVAHTDSAHWDTPHQNTAHVNTHGDVAHADGHGDTAHQNVAHQNTPHTNSHTDVAHGDIPHGDEE